jgi:hypothetical protein
MNVQVSLLLKLKLFSCRKTHGCLPVPVCWLVLAVMVLLPQNIAAKNTCRFVPALSRQQYTELKCTYDETTNTLTCNGESVPEVAYATSSYELKYPNKAAFVKEGISGQILHTSRSWGFSYMGGEYNGSFDEVQELSFENGRLVKIKITQNGVTEDSSYVVFSAWDKLGRPTVGQKSSGGCSTTNGKYKELRNIPVKIVYNDKSRKRITVRDYSKAQAVEPGGKCKEARVQEEESFDYPLGKAIGNDGQKICIE